MCGAGEEIPRKEKKETESGKHSPHFISNTTRSSGLRLFFSVFVAEPGNIIPNLPSFGFENLNDHMEKLEEVFEKSGKNEKEGSRDFFFCIRVDGEVSAPTTRWPLDA